MGWKRAAASGRDLGRAKALRLAEGTGSVSVQDWALASEAALGRARVMDWEGTLAMESAAASAAASEPLLALAKALVSAAGRGGRWESKSVRRSEGASD